MTFSETSALDSIQIFAGERARKHIEEHGLQASDFSGVVAAAGGPKGLSLIPFDRWLFGDYFAQQPSKHLNARRLYGSSIGAWRMAAASRAGRNQAIDRLATAYLERQRYPKDPGSKYVSDICRSVVNDLLNNDAHAFVKDANPAYCLQAIIAAGPKLKSSAAYKGFFGVAAAKNTVKRTWLSSALHRHVVSDRVEFDAQVFAPTGFDTTIQAFSANTVEDALLASGSIPLLADPVLNIGEDARNTAQQPQAYWDGGLIDYHMCLNYNALPGLVLYPHFQQWVTAGWLDKFLPWRKHGVGKQGLDWLSNMILVCPSPSLLARLPNGKLPDRNDFHTYGLDHDRRIKDWQTAMSECQIMAEGFARFASMPNPSLIKPL
jgi:hypothetical protein